MAKDDLISDIIGSFREHETRNAFFIDGQFYTYSELAQRVGGIMDTIYRSVGYTSQCIGIIERNTIESYAAVLAVLFSGNTYVILNPVNPDERNRTIVESTGLRLVLTSEEEPMLKEFSEKVKAIYTKELIRENGLEGLEMEQDEKALVYIIFTSGSTGVPKGVPISRGNLNAFYRAYAALNFDLKEEDRMLQMFDLCFDVSVVSTLFPLALGACAYTVPLEGVKYTTVYELLEDEDLTFAAMPPSLLTYLQPYFDEIRLPNLKYLVLTAEASNWELVSQFLPSIPNAQVVNLYGPTEATIYCTAYKVGEEDVKTYNGMLAIGKAFKGMAVKIVDEAFQEVVKGEKGELCISGPQVMTGYWNDPEKTSEVLISLESEGCTKTFYRTGDLCFEDDQDCIHYCGRLDYQVQIQGFRVELNEIEHAVRQYHGSGGNVVIAKANSMGSLELHLFLEKYDGKEKDLADYLKGKLPPYMCPKKIHALAELPLNTSGKVDRKKLATII